MSTKQFDSATDLITFTRASGGTALRKISYGSELVTNGDFATNVDGWTAQGSATVTHDASGAALVNVTGTGGGIADNQVISTVAGKVYQLSADIKLGTYPNSSFNVVINGAISGYSGITSTYQTFTTIFVASDTDLNLEYKRQTANTGTLLIDNVSVKEVTFDQPDGTLQLFNSPANVPRIEYDADGTVKGLLIEEARTNLVTQSEFASGFTNSLVTLTLNQTASPDTNINAASIVPSTANGEHFVQYILSSPSSGTYTQTVFVKANGYSKVALTPVHIGADQGATSTAKFDLTAGTSTQTGSSVPYISNLGNGWYRIGITYTTTGTVTSHRVRVQVLSDSYGYTWQANGADGIYVYGAQVEAGAFPTSYIPTTGSTATRAADFAQIPTSAFGYNNDKGSLVIDVLTPVADQFIPLAHFNTSSYFNSRALWKGNPALNASGDYFVFNSYDGTASTVGAVTKFTIDQQTQAEYTKLGLSYGDNEKAVRDGGTVLSGTSRYPNPTRLFLGCRDNGLQSQCWIKSIQYYPRRLTDTQLQELTT